MVNKNAASGKGQPRTQPVSNYDALLAGLEGHLSILRTFLEMDNTKAALYTSREYFLWIRNQIGKTYPRRTEHHSVVAEFNYIRRQLNNRLKNYDPQKHLEDFPDPTLAHIDRETLRKMHTP